MQFVYPGFLFALSALAIPVIIHLFNFRRFKKIFFTNVRFLREIKQDTRSRSRLKHLLVLIARLLAVAFLVLAFAQPLIPSENSAPVSGERNVSVYIDNSFSMDAVGKNGNLLETAKKKAREIALGYQPSDRFQILTNSFEARHQRPVNREEFIQLVDEVKPDGAVRSLSEVISRQSDAAYSGKRASHNFYYELSDFQKSVSDLEKIRNDSLSTVNLVPVIASGLKNIFIDTCSLNAPFVQLNIQNELTVRVRNISGDPAESVPVKLFINGVQRSLTSVSIDANGYTEAKLSFSVTQPGWQQAEISITDYPVTFDDTWYLSFEVKDHLSVLSINGEKPSTYVEALFNSDPYFILKNSPVNQVDYSSFSAHSMILLNELKDISSGLALELGKFVRRGGAVFVFPSAEINQSSYREFLQPLNANGYSGRVEQERRVSYIERSNSVFEDVFEKNKVAEDLDLPQVNSYYLMEKSMRSAGQVLMKLEDGSSFLEVTPVEKGKIYTCASPPDESSGNFQRHALFVPVLLKAAMSGFSSFQSPLVVGLSSEADLPDIGLTGESILHLINESEKFDVIPETRIIDNKPSISVHNQVNSAGNYLLQSGGKTISVLSFNYDRKESDLTCFTPDELKERAEESGLQMINLVDEDKNMTQAVAQLVEGTRLWKYCIWIALLFLAAEVLLIRFMKS